MKLAETFNLVALVAVIAATAFLGGCTDPLTSIDDSPSEFSDVQGNKLRHDKFLSRAVRKSGKNSGQLGLVMRTVKSDHIEKQKVLERMKTLERYKVLERFEYDDVFPGYAILVEDTTGAEDFTLFLAAIAADPEIAWVEPDFSLALPVSDSAVTTSAQMVPWSVAAIGGSESVSVSGDHTGEVDVHIYVLDSGVSHDDINVVENVDFRHGMDDPRDFDGHGTHVAGIAAAIDDYDGLVGVAPGARIHNYKVLDDNGATDISTVIAAIERLTGDKRANPAQPTVANMSIGEDIGTSAFTALDEAVQAAIDAGVVVVVSAGNKGENTDAFTPAHVPDVITVGAYDDQGRFSSFSNYGSYVDILAPGEDIVSLAPSTGGKQSAEMDGTSMAAAHVSGAAALYLALHPAATPQAVRDALINAGESFAYDLPKGTTRQSVNVRNAFEPTGTVEDVAPVDNSITLDTSVPDFLKYAAFGGEELKLEDRVHVESGDFNANIHGNSKLEARNDVIVIGFGTSGGELKIDDSAQFRPLVNLRADVVVAESGWINSPYFDAASYRSGADFVADGDLKLSGHYTLGTKDAPIVWYVDGKLRTDDATSFDGYGIFVVRGDVELKHNITTTAGGLANQVAIYGERSLEVADKELRIEALLYSNDDLSIEEAVLVEGLAVSRKKVVIRRDATVLYRPATSNLTAPIW